MAKSTKPNDDEELENEDEDVVWVNVFGSRLPIKRIYTIKEHSEYDYNINMMKYFILINESPDANTSPYSNIKVSCLSEQHRDAILDNLEREMTSSKIKFHKV